MQRPNIFLIVADSLRADHLSCYGHYRRTTPRLDALAEAGTLYAAAISPGAWAPASHASILTGLSPSEHGVSRARPELDADCPTLPEVLRTVGYRTVGISSSYWISAATGFDRGFDVFMHSWQRCQTWTNAPLERQQRRDPSYAPARTGCSARERLRTTVNLADTALRRYGRTIIGFDKGARRVNRAVRRRVSQWTRAGQPLFAFINYTEARLPYAAPAPFRRQHLEDCEDGRARRVNQQPLKLLGGRTQMAPDDFEVLGRLYDGEVAYTDHCIGELLDGLRESGALEHAIVAVTSGHGENLGDHGLMDHMFSVHDSIVRVPLIIRYPRGQHRGLEPGLVQTHDLLPTLVALAHADRPRRNGHAPRVETPHGGRMLPPFGPPRPFAISEVMQVRPPAESIMRRYPGFDTRVYGRTLRGLRTATHKYIRDSNGVEELYCLVADPAETINRAPAEPERTAQLRSELDGWEGGFTPIVRSDGAERALDRQPQELV